MSEQHLTELEFIQIATGATSGGGHHLYGLTREGRVFVFAPGLARWKPMPMMRPTTEAPADDCQPTPDRGIRPPGVRRELRSLRTF